ncbi:hypothetical protein [Paraburkholderia aspalathi]|uniref:hypothetical protein n=1 Tax=Paraburkholderia aspalathi TaxID=1324617 RepID=UPI001B28C442|nr:hypothetical protein [Paraburkholderia aspalathi]CAE6754298.1 hypothetical protein R20943_03065 [Paraburkholderia aspalathi]
MVVLVSFLCTGILGDYLTNLHADAQAREAKLESEQTARSASAREMIEYLARQHVATANTAGAILGGNVEKTELASRIENFKHTTEEFESDGFKNGYVINDTLGPLKVIKTEPTVSPKPNVDVLGDVAYSDMMYNEPQVLDPRLAWSNLMSMTLGAKKCVEYVYDHAKTFVGRSPTSINCGAMAVRNHHSIDVETNKVPTNLDALQSKYTKCVVMFITILHAYSASTFPRPDDDTRESVVSTLQGYLDTACLADTDIVDIATPTERDEARSTQNP